jgi:3-oxo-5-alpha-steroid 4-dehydrogenase 1
MTYYSLLYVWNILAVLIFILLLWIPAPYGRHSSSKWGPQINNRRAWVIMEFTVLFTLWTYLAPAINSLSVVSWTIIGLFCIHYVNRTFIFPFRIHTKGKKMPLVVAMSGIAFNVMNGSSLGYYFSNLATYDVSWFTDVRFIGGTVLFFLGMYINWKADNMLIHLRKPGQTHYSIPRTWLFEHVSCPNLLGELIEWFGFALLCWNLPALTFFIWTAANLIPRALSHHGWYKRTFPDYPPQRKAVIPFTGP